MNEFMKIREAIKKYVGDKAQMGFEIPYLASQTTDPKAIRLMTIYEEATELMHEIDPDLSDKRMIELKDEAEALVK